MAMKDITGQKFGRLTVLSFSHREGEFSYYWNARCECGKEKKFLKSNLIRSLSCGCGSGAKKGVPSKKKGRVIIDLAGTRSGRLTVLKRATSGVNPTWECRCDCGKIVTRNRNVLVMKLKNSSCGCMNGVSRKTMRRVKYSIDRIEYGYYCWHSMVKRCTDPKSAVYKYYGGRGIAVCERWMSFENFAADMGKRPHKLSLDRIDVNGGYCKENCRWATQHEQDMNKRNVRILIHNGERDSINRWSKRCGTTRRSLEDRINKGATEQEAIDYFLKRKKNYLTSGKMRLYVVSLSDYAAQYDAKMQNN